MFKILFVILVLALLIIDHKKTSRSLTILFLVITFLVMGLRHKYCYQDTFGYIQHYDYVGTLSWGEIVAYFDRDVIFWYVSKAINIISSGNYTIWLIVISFIYIASFIKLIKKESLIPAVSALIMVVLGLYYFAFTGLRQTLALAFIAFSIYYILNKELSKALLMVLIASLFHLTSLIFLIVFPLIRIRLNKKILILYVVVGFVFYVLGANISVFINSISATDRFEHYAENGSSLNFMGFFIKLLLLISSFIFLGNKRYEDKNNILLHLAIISLIAQSISAHLAEMFRISMYFSISYVLLFANSLVEYKKRTGKVDFPMLIVILLVLYIFTANNSIVNRDYSFFFDAPQYLNNR